MQHSPATLPIQEDEIHNKSRKYSFWRRGLFYLLQDHLTESIICFAIICVALCFNLYRLGSPSLWFDEILSYERARQSLSIVWKIDFATQPNMALYYIFLHFWLRITGILGILPTEFVMRLPSAIFATISSVMLYLLAKRFINQIVALVGVGLYILNTLQLTYAQETRSYSMELLLICITTYLLLAGLEHAEHKSARQDWLRWCLYSIACILMVYTHLFSVLIIGAHFVIMGILFVVPTYWLTRVRKSTLPFLLSQIATFIVLTPLLLVARGVGRTGWLPVPNLSDIKVFFVALTGGSREFSLMLLLVLVVSAICLLLSTLWSQKMSGLLTNFKFLSAQTPEQNHTTTEVMTGTKQPSLSRNTFVHALVERDAQPITWQSILPILIVLLCLAFVPFFGSYLISQGSTRLFSTRYLVATIPPLLLLIGLAIAVIPWRIVQLLMSLALLLFASLAVPYYYQSAQVENWREATFWLEEHYEADDGMACYDNGQGCEICINYYLQAYPKGISFPEDSPGSFPWVNYDLTNEVTTDPSAAIDPPSLQRYVATHAHLFFIIGRLGTENQVKRVQATEHWLDAHYLFKDQIVTSTVSVRLYQTSSYH